MKKSVRRLHIGSGPNILKGWLNVDLQPFPGLDQVLDVRRGLPFKDAELLYAEHFLEHLTLNEGMAFLRECRRVLKPEGVLRLSTPNLDWVMQTHYRAGPGVTQEEGIAFSFMLNRAFHGWGHQFLYNEQILTAVLHATGFASVRFFPYGESDLEALRGVEQHETYEDRPDLPHVLIAQATGVAAPRPLPEKLVADFRQAFV
jgi:predicted SAM-dependent methyltransferase